MENEHPCEAYPSPEDDDYCGDEPTEWYERFRCWMCAAHLREALERADYVVEQRKQGESIKPTW